MEWIPPARVGREPQLRLGGAEKDMPLAMTPVNAGCGAVWPFTEEVEWSAGSSAAQAGMTR
ncbi:MAG TPA: hypothetical protein VGK42_10100 [Candidatus Dormibacteraeota bacterium]